ncbi:hypothetical protein ACHAWX_003948 [Stephanocyclus meneghinianus]
MATPLASGSAPTDDSDLEDLITKEGSPSRSASAAKFNLDKITDHPVTTHSFLGPFYLLSYTCSLCLSSRLSKCILIFFALGLISTLINPTQKTGIMGADYSAIQSAYDLSLSQVHHWCISGDNDSCACEDPLEPQHRQEFKSWNAAHKANVAEVSLYRALYGEQPTTIDVDTGKARPGIDVAFLGESVVEAMDGRWLGKHILGKDGENQDFRRIDKTFEKFFRKEKGGTVEGVALGIAGDTASNVLWRIQHDEMPYDFNPKVWWILIGMNDLTRMQCSEEIVVLGILRVVEEIRLRKPDAKIVINSLLPMINYQGRGELTMADAVDFTARDEKARERTREVPASFRVGGKGENDDEKRHHHVRALKEKGPPPKKRDGPPPKPRNKKERERMEDKATKGPDLEKAMERKKKALKKQDKGAEKKVFRDNEKYHPKKPISPLLPMIKKHQLPPVWPAVHLINDKLKEFCAKHDSITFFDATSIFASDEGGGRHHMYVDMISPRGHPSPQGFAAWEGMIMSRLHKLLEEPAVSKSMPVETDDQAMGSEHVSDGKEASLPAEKNAPLLPGRNPQSPSTDDEHKGDEGDDDV